MSEYALATEYFDVETASVPYTHSEHPNEEGRTPEGAIIQQKDGR